MCTAVYLNEGYFGRTLDYERSFGEQVILSPRDSYRFGEAKNRYACLGVGVLDGGNPMYFDGINEFGLCGAALNFSGYADYSHGSEGLTSGKVISFILGFCRSTDEAKSAIEKLKIVGGEDSTPLHWIIADRLSAITVEQTADGLNFYENKVGVLTNSPSFPYHLTRLSDFSALSSTSPDNLVNLGISHHCRGGGAYGLPGDFSSSSRFARASFLRENSLAGQGGEMNRLRHILEAVSLPLGVVRADDGSPVSTLYASICDMENLAYEVRSYGKSSYETYSLSPDGTEGGEVAKFPLY
jgi:choloylglycine hydrolase